MQVVIQWSVQSIISLCSMVIFILEYPTDLIVYDLNVILLKNYQFNWLHISEPLFQYISFQSLDNSFENYNRHFLWYDSLILTWLYDILTICWTKTLCNTRKTVIYIQGDSTHMVLFHPMVKMWFNFWRWLSISVSFGHFSI